MGKHVHSLIPADLLSIRDSVMKIITSLVLRFKLFLDIAFPCAELDSHGKTPVPLAEMSNGYWSS